MPYQQHLDALNAEHQQRLDLLNAARADGTLQFLDDALLALDSAGFTPYPQLLYSTDPWITDKELNFTIHTHAKTGASLAEYINALDECLTAIGARFKGDRAWARGDAHININQHWSEYRGWAPARLQTQEAA